MWYVEFVHLARSVVVIQNDCTIVMVSTILYNVHVGERSCTVKKNYNYKTKEAEQIQEFINMDEGE